MSIPFQFPPRHFPCLTVFLRIFTYIAFEHWMGRRGCQSMSWGSFFFALSVSHLFFFSYRLRSMLPLLFDSGFRIPTMMKLLPKNLLKICKTRIMLVNFKKRKFEIQQLIKTKVRVCLPFLLAAFCFRYRRESLMSPSWLLKFVSFSFNYSNFPFNGYKIRLGREIWGVE